MNRGFYGYVGRDMEPLKNKEEILYNQVKKFGLFSRIKLYVISTISQFKKQKDISSRL
ncbi:hypothetical protein HYT25_04115 [Candidatus Pacearchaeota archaeon]|nr:hypothetical protein [Candidatus Pacearchaeota archaeon]